jgi:hypothetical protein
VRADPNGLRKRALVENGFPIEAGKVSFNDLQAVNVALFAGGIFLVIAVSVDLMQRVEAMRPRAFMPMVTSSRVRLSSS